jgi:leucyl aminopeptidase
MKRDKDGGCAVLGAMAAIATTIKPDRPVVALLVAAENSISDEAYRPDDVITYRNGVTVEVTNTDAEGRLVLADALCWACEKEKPGAASSTWRR